MKTRHASSINRTEIGRLHLRSGFARSGAGFAGIGAPNKEDDHDQNS